jgi:hypothetical protein
MTRERQLTVSRTYQPRRPRVYTSRPDVRVPYLRFNGLWLAEAGFPIGSKVHVQVEEGRLVVTPASPAPETAS